MHVFSKSYLQTSPDISALTSHILARKILPQIAALAATDDSIDVFSLNTAWGTDVMSAYQFDAANGTDFITDVATRNSWMAAYAHVKGTVFYTNRGVIRL